MDGGFFPSHRPSAQPEPDRVLVTLQIGAQLCGIAVDSVREVLAHPVINPIPLAPDEIVGCLNLRGRVVTALDVRRIMGMPPATDQKRMAIVTSCQDELFALIGDEVADVMTLPVSGLETCPSTLPQNWADYCIGVYRMDAKLLVILDTHRLLHAPGGKA